MSENSFICIKINSWLSTIGLRQHFFLSIDFLSITIISTADPLWSDLIKRGSASTHVYHRSHTDQHFNSWPPLIKRGLRQHSFLSPAHTDQSLQQLAFLWSDEGLASTPFYHRPIQAKFWFFSAGITPRRQHHMKVFDGFHIERYFHRFFPSWNWILNLFHFILFYIQWLVISFWSFSLMKQSYWEKWLLMIELFEKFWKVVVFRRQVCHNQYWLHTDYKPESIKIKNMNWKKRHHHFSFRIRLNNVWYFSRNDWSKQKIQNYNFCFEKIDIKNYF